MASTLIERTRRAQLIGVAISVVAERGYARASLQQIADGAGITKAAVLYHFPSKDAVIAAAVEHVLADLTTVVGTAVDAVPIEQGPDAYIRAMVAYFHDRPLHTRMVVEALAHDGVDGDASARWRPVAQLLEQAAVRRGSTLPEGRSRRLAIIVGGGIDAIVAELLTDPAFDSEAAALDLVELIDPFLAAR